MHWCNAISLHRLSLPRSLRVLGHKLESNYGMEPPLTMLTSDAAPVESKVALRLTALQGVNYCSTAITANPSQYQKGDHCCMVHCMSSNTLYIVITTQVPLHMSVL